MKLNDWLKSNSVSKREFAQRLGVSYPTVTRYLTGVRKPDWAVLPLIIDATGGAVQPNDFFDAPQSKGAAP